VSIRGSASEHLLNPIAHGPIQNRFAVCVLERWADAALDYIATRIAPRFGVSVELFDVQRGRHDLARMRPENIPCKINEKLYAKTGPAVSIC